MQLFPSKSISLTTFTFSLTLLIVSHPGWSHHLQCKPSLKPSIVHFCGLLQLLLHFWMHQCGDAAICLTAYGSDILYAPFGLQTSQLLWCQSICVKWKDFPLQWMTAYSILIRDRKSDAEKHLAQPCPPPSAAHKPRAVMTSRLARLKLMPIGLLFRLTVRKVFRDSVTILLMM